MTKLLRQVAQMPGFRRRRIRVWAATVAVIVLLLVVQSAVPQWRVLPSLGEHVGPMVMLLVFLAAMACEYVDSSLGMGYGTTLTPLLLVAGFEPLAIVPCVLLSEFVTGWCAGLMHHHDGNVDLFRDRRVRGTAGLLSVLSVAGAVAAVVFTLHVPKFWLTAIISTIILSVGVITLATAGRRLRYRPSHLVAVGAVAAFNKGLSGGGYGPLVTAGQLVSGVPAKQAVAITSLAESLTCFVGLVAYIAMHGHIDWVLALPLTAGGLLSVPIATLTVRRLPETGMRTGVGVVTCLLGILALTKLFW